MNLAAQEYLIPIQEYLEGEQHSEIRHEYLAGRVYAMAGAGEKHNRIAGNLFFHLRAAARGKECGVFISDMKVRVEQNDAFYYPDVMVTCDPQDTESLHKHSPCLIVEVLSPATEAIDRREKLVAYRTLSSLRYYLLVSQDKRQIECFTRITDDRWNAAIIENAGTLEILCDGLAATISLDEIYEDVRL
jgi:Uma2 family endonuclease